MAEITTLFIDKGGVLIVQRMGPWSDDWEHAISWAGGRGLRGVLVRRQAGEPFEDSVMRAFDQVSALL